jgi:hypothetical protein
MVMTIILEGIYIGKVAAPNYPQQYVKPEPRDTRIYIHLLQDR